MTPLSPLFPPLRRSALALGLLVAARGTPPVRAAESAVVPAGASASAADTPRDPGLVSATEPVVAAKPFVLSVDPRGVARVDLVVQADLDLQRLRSLAEERPLIDENDFVLRELGADGSPIAAGGELVFQIDFRRRDEAPGLGRLHLWLPGTTAPDQVRRFRLEGRTAEEAVAANASVRPSPLRVDFSTHDVDQAAYRVTTPQADYFYQLEGASFSSLHDRDGEDWLGYSLAEGPFGKHRGLPNMGHPAGYMHPGVEKSTTRLETAGPVTVALYSESKDGNWAGRWEIHPDHAVMTVLKTHEPYWFLYEGTPGGTVEPEEDHWIRADGSTGNLLQFWRYHAMEADWVAFADGAKERSILLVHEVNDSNENSYWLMKRAMTVFGFGRGEKQSKTITETPRRFYVSLVETRDHAELKRRADSWLAPLGVTVE